MRWTTLLIDHPWLSLIPAVLLLGLWAVRRSRMSLVAAVLWLAYLGWEFAVKETPRPSIRSRSNLAPDRASAGRSGSRSLASAISSSNDPATRGMSMSVTLLLMSLKAPA